VSTTFLAITAAPANDDARARHQFTEIELEHALRATASQQLRVAAAARSRAGVDDRRIAAIEQAIADRIDRIVTERREAVHRARDRHTPGPATDDLASRRRRAVPSAGRSHARA
jgi:hypothetical protein